LKINLFYYSLYDFANSAFVTIIITFIFSNYFVNSVAQNIIEGQAYWGWTISLSGFLVAITGPFLGVIADKKNINPFILKISTYACIVFTSLLWFSKPEVKYIFFTLFIICAANYFYELSSIFYNSLLIDTSNKKKLGFASGFSFALGYLGGIISLLITINFIIESDYLKNLGESLSFRGSAIFVSIWFLIFSLPLIFSVKIRGGIKKKKNLNLKKILWDSGLTKISKFLIARLFYGDGLNTIFVMGGIFAVSIFSLNLKELLLMSILMNVSAMIGAWLGGYFNDKFSCKSTILISLIFLILLSILIILSKKKLYFFIFTTLLGFFIGPIQSASRVMISKLIRHEDQNKAFGLFTTSGKLTSFFGPALVGSTTLIFENQRIGFSMVLILLILGFIILYKTKDLK
jgi:UMF1 family MFS transporter